MKNIIGYVRDVYDQSIGLEYIITNIITQFVNTDARAHILCIIFEIFETIVALFDLISCI